jgi:hypothetical protein
MSLLTERDLSREASIIINDLDSMVHRIEMLQAHPHYTNAMVAVQKAREEMLKGQRALHGSGMRERFAQMDGAR